MVRGPTTKLATFEAFAEIEPGVEELIHISELPDERITHRSRSCAKARASCCESSRSTRPATISASARGRWTTRRTSAAEDQSQLESPVPAIFWRRERGTCAILKWRIGAGLHKRIALHLDGGELVGTTSPTSPITTRPPSDSCGRTRRESGLRSTTGRRGMSAEYRVRAANDQVRLSIARPGDCAIHPTVSDLLEAGPTDLDLLPANLASAQRLVKPAGGIVR